MMSNEEWDRKVEFLLNQQAKFDADMAELKAAQKESEKKLESTRQMISSQATIMFEAFKITDAGIRDLKETQKKTEQALEKLIIRFDRHLTEGHTGLET